MNKKPWEPSEKEFIFETRDEIVDYLKSGGFITNLDNSCSCYVYWKDGDVWITDQENPEELYERIAIFTPSHWRPFPAHMIKRSNNLSKK